MYIDQSCFYSYVNGWFLDNVYFFKYDVCFFRLLTVFSYLWSD